MGGNATDLNKMFCRFCGHEDNLTFCSQCGLPLEHEVKTLTDYLRDRVWLLVEPALQFLFTLIPLLFRPCKFFRTLVKEDAAMDGLLILGFGKKPDSFRSWCRPLTTVGYLFAATLIGALLVTSALEIDKLFPGDEIEEALLSTNIPDFFFFIALISQGTETLYLPGLLIELTLLLTLFGVLKPYQCVLGIKPDRTEFFVEYFLYMATQFLFCWGISVAIATYQFPAGSRLVEFIPILEFSFPAEFLLVEFIVIVGFLVFSIYYFLIVPLLIFPQLYCVKRWRISISYFVTLAIMPFIHMFYLLYGLSRLRSRARRRRT